MPYKEFYVFSPESYFIKAIENVFSCVCIAWYKHFVSGLHNCLEFSQPLSCLYQAMQTQENVFYCLNISCFILLSCVVLNLNTASFDDDDHYCYHHHFIRSTIIIIITFISVNFYFSFVSNFISVHYHTPKQWKNEI